MIIVVSRKTIHSDLLCACYICYRVSALNAQQQLEERAFEADSHFQFRGMGGTRWKTATRPSRCPASKEKAVEACTLQVPFWNLEDLGRSLIGLLLSSWAGTGI